MPEPIINLSTRDDAMDPESSSRRLFKEASEVCTESHQSSDSRLLSHIQELTVPKELLVAFARNAIEDPQLSNGPETYEFSNLGESRDEELGIYLDLSPVRIEDLRVPDELLNFSKKRGRL